MTLSALADEEDQFLDFSFLKTTKQTPVMTMQQIFLQEKGGDHLRTQNINYLHTLRNDGPNLEVLEPKRKRGSTPAPGISEEVKSSVPVEALPEAKPAPTLKVQKSLKLAKSEDGKKKEIKVTTTIVKAKPTSKTPAKKGPVKKSIAKKVAPKRKIIKVKA